MENMLKPTATNLKKVENIFKELGYKIIYEKGHFQSGYCIVNAQNMIVVNKFYKTDARINCLLIILKDIELIESDLQEETFAFYTTLNFDKLEA
jgi:hypothetical protein